MIVRMSKMRMTAMLSEREKLLDALHKTQMVELRETPAEEGDIFCVADENLKNKIKDKYERTLRCIEFIEKQMESAKKQPYYPKENTGLGNDIIIGYDDFMSTPGNEVELFSIIGKTEEYTLQLAKVRAERARLETLMAQLAPYLGVGEKFSDFSDTEYTRCAFGLLPDSALPAFKAYIEEKPLTEFVVFTKGRMCAVSAVSHLSEAEEVFKKLGELSFVKCPFTYSATAEEKIEELTRALARCDEKEREVNRETCGKSAYLRNLKILSDYYALQSEKIAAAEKFTGTKCTFTLSGYLPEEEVPHVKNAVYDVTDAVFMEFTAPSEEDTPPTLLKNRGPAKTAEFVTNMYSAPDYKEFDPNGFVFVFFMIFFGLIMADIGYGALLLIGGAVLLTRLKIDNGFKKLVYIITYGGAFTILFGALFGSLFGFAVYRGVLPDPTAGRTNVLVVLLGCMALGLLQITVGYILKAVNSFRQGAIADGIFDGLTWVLFDIGLFFAVFNFITDYFDIPVAADVKGFFDAMTMPGVVMLGTGLLVAVFTAGRKEKLIGKFTKGFGAVYGIINLLSDVLSYARLFGLMLSGMIIAQQFNAMGTNILAGGGIGYVFGPLVMLVGHAFNIAMGVLGAYIHDCRLQYIEFFSKFYTGEGELFTPLGSRFQYVRLTK